MYTIITRTATAVAVVVAIAVAVRVAAISAVAVTGRVAARVAISIAGIITSAIAVGAPGCCIAGAKSTVAWGSISVAVIGYLPRRDSYGQVHANLIPDGARRMDRLAREKKRISWGRHDALAR